MIGTPRVPRVFSAGRWWSPGEIASMAVQWRNEIVEAIGEEASCVAAVLPGHHEGVALLCALSSLRIPVVLMNPDTASLGRGPSLPAGTAVALPASLIHAAPAVAARGGIPCVLSAFGRPTRSGEPELSILQNPGFVLFTSGSTGAPKPVFRGTTPLLAGVTARAKALGLEEGDGIVAGVSLAHGHGLTRVLSAMILGGSIALLDPLDHRGALAVLARSEFTCWSATAHFADVLSRCTLTGPAMVPRICLVSSPISQGVFDAFRKRFNTPLRQNYSSSETGVVAVNALPADQVSRESVGHPVAGVEVRIANDAAQTLPAGEVGRIWVRSPWLMAGYGFPPYVQEPERVDGWWRTRDLGRRREDGELILAGRVDDCIRTREGRLVDLAFIANSLRAADGVRDVAVVAFQSSAGASFGAVLECEPSTTAAVLKERLSRTLPQWSWPRTLTIVESLPRLANGKADQLMCSNMLRDET